MRIGINGFGRIGRNIFRAVQNDQDIEIVAVNDLTDPATLAHLLKHDSVSGALPGTVRAEGNEIVVISPDGHETRLEVLSERDPAALPWGRLGVEIVVESTGIFTKREDASKHLAAGARKVIISAPAKGEDLTVVMGVNEDRYDPDNPITSFRTLPAPRTVSRQWSRSSTRRSASRRE